jgi:hypothetical protein
MVMAICLTFGQTPSGDLGSDPDAKLVEVSYLVVVGRSTASVGRLRAIYFGPFQWCVGH